MAADRRAAQLTGFFAGVPAVAAYAVVTGVGAVTPFGLGAPVLREGLLAGRPTAGPIRGFGASDLPVRFACEVPGFDPAAHLPAKLARRTDRFSQFALVAATEALAGAGLLAGAAGSGLVAGVDPERVAVVVASGNGGGHGNGRAREVLRTGGPDRLSPYLTVTRPVDAAAAAVAHRLGLGGPAIGVATACASGTDALGLGLDLLRAGRADVVVAGGAEAALDRLTLAAFARAGALSRRNDDPAAASRPFDADRDGFVCGEGAGLLVLERPQHAAARRAAPLARLAGYGATTDARHPVEPAPDGAAAARAVRLALRDAGLGPGDVDHVDAHGTATVLNDPAEARALRIVFGAHLDAVPVTAIKSAIGHLMGAAGAVAAVAAVGTITDGLVPPTQNHDRTDPLCALDVVTGGPRRMGPRVVLSEAFGFGGHNSAIVLVAP